MPHVPYTAAEKKEFKKEKKELAEEYVEAVAANDHRKADKLAKEIDASNRDGTHMKVPLTARKVNAAFAAAKGNKDFLRQYVMSPGAHSHLWKGGCWGMTRRRRGSKATRKNGFKLF